MLKSPGFLDSRRLQESAAFQEKKLLIVGREFSAGRLEPNPGRLQKRWASQLLHTVGETGAQTVMS